MDAESQWSYTAAASLADMEKLLFVVFSGWEGVSQSTKTQPLHTLVLDLDMAVTFSKHILKITFGCVCMSEYVHMSAGARQVGYSCSWIYSCFRVT